MFKVAEGKSKEPGEMSEKVTGRSEEVSEAKPKKPEGIEGILATEVVEGEGSARPEFEERDYCSQGGGPKPTSGGGHALGDRTVWGLRGRVGVW